MFSEGEKYLMYRAIQERKEKLDSTRVFVKSMDHDNISADVEDYSSLAEIFKTKLWS